jgi:hypothetical protein
MSHPLGYTVWAGQLVMVIDVVGNAGVPWDDRDQDDNDSYHRIPGPAGEASGRLAPAYFECVIDQLSSLETMQ